MPSSQVVIDEARWQVVLAREMCRNERFVYAVRSTGVYCRPGCPSRRPRRENVVFFQVPDAGVWHQNVQAAQALDGVLDQFAIVSVLAHVRFKCLHSRAVLLTNDPVFQRITGLEVLVLEDFVLDSP